MKINNLVKYLKSIDYNHKKWANISPNIKCKIYEAYIEKTSKMSINRFCYYLKKIWISRSTVKNIIFKWEKTRDGDPLSESFWKDLEISNYSNRYKNTSRAKKIKSFSKSQIDYIINLRRNNPTMWYMRLKNMLSISKNKQKFEEIFWKWFHLSSRQFYNIISLDR